jgi:hypothetical protein
MFELEREALGVLVADGADTDVAGVGVVTLGVLDCCCTTGEGVGALYATACKGTPGCGTGEGVGVDALLLFDVLGTTAALWWWW